MSSDGTQKGIWRKDSSGWTNITPSAWSGATYNRVVIGINPSNQNQVYFLGETPNIGKATTNYIGDIEWNSLLKYTYISGNGTGSGGQWLDLSPNIPYDSSQMGNFNSQGGYDLVVKVYPDSSNIVFIGGTNLFRSTDGFTTKNHTTTIGGYAPGSTLPFYTNYPNHHSDQHNLVFLPSNHDVMISTSDGGVIKTMNNRASSVAWQPLNDGYVTSQFYSVAIDHGSTPNDIVIGDALYRGGPRFAPQDPGDGIQQGALAMPVLAGEAERVHPGKIYRRYVLAVGHKVLEFQTNGDHITVDYT